MKQQGGIPRFDYDLSGSVNTVGKLGRLQTAFIRPIVAGDTISLNYRTNLRASPVRRPLSNDFHVSVDLFFVPYRNIYSTDWKTFCLQGQDEGVTFTTRTFSSGRNECLGTHIPSGSTIPLWLSQGYIDIYNRYYKHPADSDVAADVFDSLSHLIDDRMDYGFQCGWHPSGPAWTRVVLEEVADADRRFALVDTDKIDLTTMASQQGRLKTETVRQWYAAANSARWSDIMRETYGTFMDTAMDVRPEHLGHQEVFLSSFDVNGTDASTLGTVSGKVVGELGITMPPKYFVEHGTLWCLILIRPQAIAIAEQDYLSRISQPSYSQIMGDPDICSRATPITNDMSKWLSGSTVTTGSIMPDHQWFREGANRTHQLFSEADGFPFHKQQITDLEYCKYLYSGQWDEIFTSLELAHWHANGHVNIRAKRVVPPPMVGAFAGVN